jgi:hypothetical protein
VTLILKLKWFHHGLMVESRVVITNP